MPVKIEIRNRPAPEICIFTGPVYIKSDNYREQKAISLPHMKPPYSPTFNPRRACPWPRPPRLVNVRRITPEELDGWMIHHDDQVIVFDKPGNVVCHPSKDGPWSSLAGAVRERFGLAAAHLVFRLDRETSGVVVFAKNPEVAARLQTAMQRRQVGKTYLAIMTGELRGPVTVD